MSQVAEASPSTAPTSAQFAATVQRGYGYAGEQAHRLVTAEHLLLALTEDVDALAVLQRKGIDIDHLRNEVASLVSRNNDRFLPGEEVRPAYGADFRRVMNIAGGAASPRRPIDGALMLSALIADGTTPAAELIKLYGLSFEDTSRTSRPLMTASVAPPSLANVRSNAREAALGYRLRNGAAADFVALVPGDVGLPQNGARRGPPAVREQVAEPDWQARTPVAYDQQRTGPTADWADSYLDTPAPPPLEQYPPQADAYGWQRSPADNAGQPPADWSGYGYPDEDARSAGAAEPAWSKPPAGPPPVQQQARQRSLRQGEPRPAQEGRRAADPGAVPKTKGRKSSGKSRRQFPDRGLLLENIPRRMQVGQAAIIEAQIARRDIEAAVLDLLVANPSSDPAEPITHALTVRLRSPDGAMTVETGSPETQWVESTLGLLQDDFSSWRWTLTPKWKGATELQLMISARALTPQGLMGETALPDQLVEVMVASNYGTFLRRLAGWIGVTIAAGVIGAVGEHLLRVVGRILTH